MESGAALARKRAMAGKARAYPSKGFVKGKGETRMRQCRPCTAKGSKGAALFLQAGNAVGTGRQQNARCVCMGKITGGGSEQFMVAAAKPKCASSRGTESRPGKKKKVSGQEGHERRSLSERVKCGALSSSSPSHSCLPPASRLSSSSSSLLSHLPVSVQDHHKHLS